jgi:hypothetical protein
MRKLTQWYRLAAVVAAVGTVGCKSLEVANPNAPDAARAFSDPGAVAGLVTGAFRNWFNVRGAYWGALTLSTVADSYSASWNNADLRFYSSYGPIGNGGADCPQRCGWDNTPSGSHRLAVESFWYGYYGTLSSVNDVLTAIRKNDVILTDDATTKMHEAVSVMLQGVVFANIALNYDKGFVVTENTDISNPATLPFRPRAEVRDSAIKKFDQAIALMGTSPFALTPSTWTGTVNGPRYSSAQLIQIMHTAQAELLANFPRNQAENAAVNWAQVATYASQGISSGTAFDFLFFQDTGTLYDWVKGWGNALGTARVDTRVATLFTGAYAPALGTGPIYNDPYPNHPEPQPHSADKRVGNGTWGPSNNAGGNGGLAADAGAGTDFAWVPAEILNPARGTYHRSSLGHMRFSYLASPGSGLPGEDGRGLDPLYTRAQNDLLWAEGLIRSGGSAAQAAALINKTRVTRGGLAALNGAEGTPTLLLALHYEQEVEEMGNSTVPFHNRRRQTQEGYAPAGVYINPAPQCGTAGDPGLVCLWPQTPRQMPVPAKELSVLQQELYSFGGPGNPDLAPGVYQDGVPIWSARQIGEAMIKATRPSVIGRRRN